MLHTGVALRPGDRMLLIIDAAKDWTAATSSSLLANVVSFAGSLVQASAADAAPVKPAMPMATGQEFPYRV